jgi:DNA mismatch repair protein MutS
MSLSDDLKIYGEYFKITKEYQSKYGKNTVLLMQVGSFFEIYGIKQTTTLISKYESEIVEITNICQLNISEKKATYNGEQLLMAGFPDYKLEKYLEIITENYYTAVVYVQEKNEKNTKRIFHSVHSAGTYISYETDKPNITNNIMCIWVETYKPSSIKVSLSTDTISSYISKTRDTAIFGISVANIFTGKSSMFEYQNSLLMNPTTFDELERFVSVFSPSEVILVTPFDDNINENIIQYSGICNSIIHRCNLNDITNEKVQNCSKQKYIQHILKTLYGEETYSQCSEFNTNIVATQSYCYLLNFIQEHNPNLIKKISIPIFNNSSDRMILANHTLKQLNIIDDISNDSKRSGKLSSVLKFLNKSCTSMGKRLFQHQLLHPTFNTTWLNKEYNIVDHIIINNHYYLVEQFRKVLVQVKDIEKILRQLLIKKVYPSSIYHLYNSFHVFQQIYICLYENKQINEYLCEGIPSSESIEIQTNSFIHFIEDRLIIANCKNVNSNTSFESNIIQPGVCSKLDSLLEKKRNNEYIFKCFREQLNKQMNIYEKTNEIEYVKEHETEKSGISLQITKKRGQSLKKMLTSMQSSGNNFIELTSDFIINTNDIHIISGSTAGNEQIECKQITEVAKELLYSKCHINTAILNIYNNVLDTIEKDWFGLIENISLYLAKFDVLLTKTYIAKEYNYCKPVIDENNGKSYINACDLRHCLIEHIQQNELYVSNDISIGNEIDGILLYGTNAVGKTSIIRALGISCILAQSGIYVPCSKFVYKPYTAIFSRILGNDNLFKGLSTFAVEMSELRTILKMADNRSLILGDELCSGTETESAISIFISGLQLLSTRNSSFIFATHFHEIINYKEITNISRLKMKHLSVYYDRETDCLVYDRKLKDGSGTRMYGLEVCKSLYLPEDFLQNAYLIRNKYFPDTNGELINKTSTYNAKKVKGMCEICKTSISEEVHHLQPQKDANKDGFIGNFHKNHVANLLNVCEKCHNEFHSPKTEEKQKKIIKRKTTKGYIITNEPI